MKEWIKKIWTIIRSYFNSIVGVLASLPVKVLQLIAKLLDGVTTQISTARGATIFIVVVLVLFDAWNKGTAGVIQFTLNVVTKFIADILKVVEQTGVLQLAIVCLLVVFYLDYRKKK